MKRLSCMLFLLAVSTAAFAQVGEISASFGTARARNNDLATITTSTGTETVKVDTGFRFGFRFTMNSWRHFGHEFGYAYTRSHLKSPSIGDISMPVHQGMYDFLAYATPEGSKIRPFASGGVHFSAFYPPGASVYYGNGVTKFGVNYGGGIKFKVSDIFLVRMDVHDYTNPKPDLIAGTSGWMHMLEVSAGLAFAF